MAQHGEETVSAPLPGAAEGSSVFAPSSLLSETLSAAGVNSAGLSSSSSSSSSALPSSSPSSSGRGYAAVTSGVLHQADISMTPRLSFPAVPPPVATAMPGLLGSLLVFVLHTLPSALFWIIGFATITLPTWLFTLFSMSLTFTMNFTTL
jgi:lysophospholipid hydrolase